MKREAIHTHARYAQVMKRIFIGGIFLLLLIFFGWPYLMSLSQKVFLKVDVSHSAIQENHMLHPQYISTDAKGQPYEIQANWAKQRTDILVDLEAPHGSLTLNEGQSLSLKASQGTYNLKEKILGLEGGVLLISTDGYQAKTEKAQASLDAKTIEGHTYFEGEGPSGRLKGQNGFKMEIYPEGKVVTLKGPSQIIIEPAALKKAPPHE